MVQGDVTEPPKPICLADFEALARPKLSAGAYAYYRGGSGREVSVRENEEAFARRRFRPRVLVDVSHIDTRASIFGTEWSVPFGIAPTAQHGLAHPDAEAATARAAASRGVLYCASTSSTLSCETIAQSVAAPRWFQLYVQDGAGPNTSQLLERVRRSSYEAVVLTVDLPVLGLRVHERRAGFELDSQPFGNFPNHGALLHPTNAAFYAAEQSRASFTWNDLEWLKAQTDMPLVLKGISSAEDALLGVEHGADAIWVSNHGGRQLDGAPAPLDVLEEVVAAVAGRVPVFIDGGVRQGTDVVTALALGASFVFVGRPILYALAYAGQDGVCLALDLLRAELTNAMALLGTPDLSAITRRCLR